MRIPNRYRIPGGAKIHEEDLLELEANYVDSPYGKPKFLEFIRKVYDLHQFTIKLYDSQSTVSKYVTLYKGKKSYKIRWSNHKPNFNKEKAGACDFFVGVTNLKVTTTEQAYKAALAYFKEEDKNAHP